jgi:hypothetical protein
MMLLTGEIYEALTRAGGASAAGEDALPLSGKRHVTASESKGIAKRPHWRMGSGNGVDLDPDT